MFRTPRKTKIGVKNRIVLEIGLGGGGGGDCNVRLRGNDSWFELSGGSKKREFEKSSCHRLYKSHFKHFKNFEKGSQLSV